MKASNSHTHDKPKSGYSQTSGVHEDHIYEVEQVQVSGTYA